MEIYFRMSENHFSLEEKPGRAAEEKQLTTQLVVNQHTRAGRKPNSTLNYQMDLVFRTDNLIANAELYVESARLNFSKLRDLQTLASNAPNNSSGNKHCHAPTIKNR